MTQDISPKVYIPIISVILALLSAGIFFREPIQDWWYFQTYNPSYLIEKVSEDAGFTDYGDRLFWRADPQLVDQKTLDEQCGTIEIIGCIITGPRVYIKNFSETDDEYDQAVVTAAHEMLHLAYFRLSSNEKAEINELLDEAMRQVRDQDVLFRIESYEPEAQHDETHSILATEVEQLTPQLETYYEQYFDDDRVAVLDSFARSRNLIE